MNNFEIQFPNTLNYNRGMVLYQSLFKYLKIKMETQQNEQKYSDCAGKLSYQPTAVMRCLLLATEKYVRIQNEFSIPCLLPEFSQYNR